MLTACLAKNNRSSQVSWVWHWLLRRWRCKVVRCFRGQAFDMMRSGGTSKITYEMKGKFNGAGFNSTHFRTQGEFTLPAS
jgi:hypothetical protein